MDKTTPSPVLAKSCQVDMEQAFNKTFCWVRCVLKGFLNKAAWSFQGGTSVQPLHCFEPRKATSSKGHPAAPAGTANSTFHQLFVFSCQHRKAELSGGMWNTSGSAYQLQTTGKSICQPSNQASNCHGGNRNTIVSKQICVFFSFLYRYLLVKQRSSLCH